MKTYEVTVWPENARKPYTARYDAPTSIDALNRALGSAREVDAPRRTFGWCRRPSSTPTRTGTIG